MRPDPADALHPPARGARRRIPLRRRLLYAFVPLLLLLLVGEVVARLVRDPLHFGSFRELRLDLMRRNYPAALDDTLGYAPRPGFRSRDNHWGTMVTIDAAGLRSNGLDAARQAGLDGPPIVCIGDSFTFGDQVDDAESWPAQLQEIVQRPVYNGGVFGYSMTQAILRGEQLMDRHRPRELVLGMIADDLWRSTYERRYTRLPWFDFADDGSGLVLRGVPVDHGPREPDSERWLKDALGCSALLDALLASLARQWYYESDKQVPIPHLQVRLVDLGRGLVDRLRDGCAARGVRAILVLQGQERPAWIEPVLEHARATGVEVLDLVREFEALAAHDPSLAQRWFDGHMTAEGNAWVARRIAETIDG